MLVTKRLGSGTDLTVPLSGHLFSRTTVFPTVVADAATVETAALLLVVTMKKKQTAALIVKQDHSLDRSPPSCNNIPQTLHTNQVYLWAMHIRFALRIVCHGHCQWRGAS